MCPLSPFARSLLAVAGIQLLLWWAWGSPTPIFDEAGYLAAGEAVARWLHCTPAAEPCASAQSLGRLLWHNPGYAALFVAAELLPGAAAQWIRALQLLAGLLAGACVHRLLLAPAGPRWALAAAWGVWLHPVQLFFRLTLWPVALSTAAIALVALLASRFARSPTPGRRLELSLGLLGLTLLYPMALACLPLLALWVLAGERVSRWETAGWLLMPTALCWIGLMGVTSSALSVPSLGLLAGPENAALGNNPYIAAGRGSSLHDKDSVQRLRAWTDAQCPRGPGLSSLRCTARAHRHLAAQTASEDPVGAVVRAGLRVFETWSPDRFVARHLAEPRIGIAAGPAVGWLVRVVEIVTLALLLVIAFGATDRRVLGILVVLGLCTLPVVLGVGLTRLREPLLPLLVIGAALSLSRYHRRP